MSYSALCISNVQNDEKLVHVICVIPFLILAELNGTSTNCDCNAQCHRVTYEASLSYAQLSRFNIEHVVLNSAERQGPCVGEAVPRKGNI